MQVQAGLFGRVWEDVLLESVVAELQAGGLARRGFVGWCVWTNLPQMQWSSSSPIESALAAPSSFLHAPDGDAASARRPERGALARASK